LTALKKRAAFFDIDYTLLCKSSMMLYVDYMRRQGEYGLWDVLVGGFYLLQYKLNLLDIESAMDKAGQSHKGMSEQKLAQLCERWFEEEVVHYLYPEALELLESHRAAGDELCILSATSIYLTRPLSRHLGISHYFCNQPLVKDGVLTGGMHKPLCYGRAKLDYALQFEAATGIRLEDSFYYSDSITDLETLAGFGHPVAVNPDRFLKREAKARGWKILNFEPPAWLKSSRRPRDVIKLKVL
jgi:HAD superfamily hydrolase (TIGR01490 family)